ncbi:unnamed protein product, partial [Prorocentrum cordatum]
QAETLAHKLITTGQEAVENSKHGFREDLYKKHISADPIAARLPYGIVTHLVSLYGWKRLELNKLIKFTGVTLPGVDSIHRRSWVVILKAKFLPPDLAAAIPNASNKGIFCKDPKLKDVLKSAPAALALWQILHGFMRKHTKDDSEDEKLAMRIAVVMLDNCIDSVTVEEFSNKLGVGLVTDTVAGIQNGIGQKGNIAYMPAACFQGTMQSLAPTECAEDIVKLQENILSRDLVDYAMG